MKKNKFQQTFLKLSLWAFGMGLLVPATNAQTPKLTLDFSKPGATVNPMFYGLMTEEINHSYDGGLYAELIRNRVFKDNPTTPEAWSLVREDSGIESEHEINCCNRNQCSF